MKTLGVKATDEDLEEKEHKFDEYKQKEYSVQHILLTTVSPCLAMIIKSMSAVNMWTAICLNTMKKSQLHKVDMHHRLQSMLCSEDADVKAHLNAMLKI